MNITKITDNLIRFQLYSPLNRFKSVCAAYCRVDTDEWLLAKPEDASGPMKFRELRDSEKEMFRPLLERFRPESWGLYKPPLYEIGPEWSRFLPLDERARELLFPETKQDDYLYQEPKKDLEIMQIILAEAMRQLYEAAKKH